MKMFFSPHITISQCAKSFVNVFYTVILLWLAGEKMLSILYLFILNSSYLLVLSQNIQDTDFRQLIYALTPHFHSAGTWQQCLRTSFYPLFWPGANSEKQWQQVLTSTWQQPTRPDGPRELLFHLCRLCSVVISVVACHPANMPFNNTLL